MEDITGLLKFYIGLTPRQREVLQLVSMGLTNQEIARRLCVTPGVIAGHLTNIYEELAAAGFPAVKSSRYQVILLFGTFFQRHPELDNFAQRTAS